MAAGQAPHRWHALDQSSVLVTRAEGKHLFPFRTEQLSPPAPMIVGPQGLAKVGRRQDSGLIGTGRRPFRPRPICSDLSGPLSRTEKLSLSGLLGLPPPGGGRAGRRRAFEPKIAWESKMAKKDKKVFRELERLQALYLPSSSAPAASPAAPTTSVSASNQSAPAVSSSPVAAGRVVRRELIFLLLTALLTLAFLFLVNSLILTSRFGEVFLQQL